MSIDFLDRLEADLREAAERRGEPSPPRRRRPRPGPPLKALAVAAVLALLVVGGARLANRDTTERPAGSRPTPGTGGPVKTAVATTGDASSLEVYVQRLAAAPDLKFVLPRNGASALADPSLGTVVLYRNADAKEFAASVARAAGIDDVRPLTEADEEKISFDVSRATLVIIFGTELQDALLERAEDCTPAGRVTGGELSLCVVHGKQTGTISGFLVDGEPRPVARMSDPGHWMWAAASPDGKTILAQWSGECEVPQAFLLDAGGWSPRAVAPNNAASRALGWTTDGRAIVSRPADAACGAGGDPGLYLFTPGGDPTLIGKAVPRDLEPSIEPRSVEAVIGAIGR
jgi:hypothetical protein